MNRPSTHVGLRTWALVALVILALPVSVVSVKANIGTLNFRITASAKPQLEGFTFIQTSYPVTVGLSVNTSLAAVSYFWQFGDGTNSTSAAPSHTYWEACVYEVSVTVTDARGNKNFGNVSLGMFTAKGLYGSIAVCPPQGTAGFTPVSLAGGFFSAKSRVNLIMNGTSIANVTSNAKGNFKFDLNSSLPASVNGTKFVFTTSPVSLTRTFTTLEGIRAYPSSGVPGDTVIVEGRSYPALAEVGIYLGGAYLGQTQADGNGMFMTSEVIPVVPPLLLIGTYPYSTTPPILGTGANFRITANSYLAEVASLWWLILLIIAIVIIVVFYVRRWRKQRTRLQPQPPEELPPWEIEPSETE